MQVEDSDSYDFGTRVLTFVSVNGVCLTCSHVQQAKRIYHGHENLRRQERTD